MRIDILSVVPELLESPLKYSIVGRAIKKGLVEIHVHNIRKYGIGSRATVDDYSYGGDAGMVMMVEPVERMINELRSERDYDEIIYLSPDGELLNQGILIRNCLVCIIQSGLRLINLILRYECGDIFV